MIAKFCINNEVDAHLFKRYDHLSIRFSGNEKVEDCQILLELDGSILELDDGEPVLTYPGLPVNVALKSIWHVQKWIKKNPQK